MNIQEQEKLITALMATAEVMGNEIKPNVAIVMVDDLDHYLLDDVLKALVRIRRECSGKLTLKTIIEKLAPAGGWISANEAWAIALPAADEAETVVWTQEIAKAWVISKPIFEAGDKVGARMAFIPAYERFVESARNEGRLPQFEISAGWDADRRDRAVTNAVTAGLLPAPVQDQKALAAPVEPILFDDHVSAYHRYEMSTRLKQLSALLKGQKEDKWKERIKATEQAQKIHQAKRDEIIRQMQEQS